MGMVAGAPRGVASAHAPLPHPDPPFAGTHPVGWLGPGLTQTHETPELLAEAGIRYAGDWVHTMSRPRSTP